MVKIQIVPFKASFMLTSIIGFLVSVYFVMSYSKNWGFAFAIFFATMFIASIISMTYAQVLEK